MIWEKGQLVVLTSRTKCMEDMIFVGNRKDILECLAAALYLRSQYDEYMDQILNVLSGRTQEGNVIEQAVFPYRPKEFPMPPPGSGVVYLLVSCRDRRTTYIGETCNLHRRMLEHNSGNGSKQTAKGELMPWGLLACVVGFEDDVLGRKHFEQLWQSRRDYYRSLNNAVYTPMNVVDWGISAVEDMNLTSTSGHTLRMIRTGTIGTTL